MPGVGVGQFAQVGGEEDLIVHGQGGHIAPIRAHGQDGSVQAQPLGQAHRSGNQAPAATHDLHLWPPPPSPRSPLVAFGLGLGVIRQLTNKDHALFAGMNDAQAVEEKAVAHGTQMFPGLAVLGADGFAGPVAAGDHQGSGDGLDQNMVKSRIGQDHAKFSATGGDLVGKWGHSRRDRGPCTFAQEDDRGFGRGEQGLLCRGKVAIAGGLGAVAHHDGQGTVGLPLVGPQSVNRLAVCGQTHEVETPHALDGHNAPLQQGRHRGGNIRVDFHRQMVVEKRGRGQIVQARMVGQGIGQHIGRCVG